MFTAVRELSHQKATHPLAVDALSQASCSLVGRFPVAFVSISQGRAHEAPCGQSVP
jgi:hypothetical protein